MGGGDSDNEQIPLHKRIAMGLQDALDGGGEDYGVEKLKSHSEGKIRNYVHPGETLPDHKRNAPVRHSRGMGQSNPDHGDY